MLERSGSGRRKRGNREPVIRREGEVVRWYDREDHARFDVCADDHCQRYQGITGRVAGRAAEAVRETRGVFLIQEGADLRRPLPQGVRRHDRGLRHLLGGDRGSLPLPRLRLRNAPSPRSGRRRMRSAGSSPVPTSPAARTIRTLLRRILPAFDRETADFFRWQVSYRTGGTGGDTARRNRGSTSASCGASYRSNAVPPAGSACCGSRDRRPR